MNRRIIAGAVALYLMGAILHLNVLQREPGAIWGDAGDGFFNLWVLNHVSDSIAHGDLNVADGRVFWPDHKNTLFWSDNLIAVAPLFAFSKWITSSLFDAFWLTGLLLSIVQYAALLFMFYQAYALAREQRNDTSPSAAWLIPVCAYLAHFSPAVLVNHFMHIQNLTALGVFALVGGVFGYMRKPGATRLYVTAAALLFTLYTAPYYTVAGIILLLAWLACASARQPRQLMQHIWDGRLVLSFIFVLAAILAAFYMREGRLAYLPSDIKTFAIGWSDLFIPSFGWLRDVLNARMEHYPGSDHERIAWLGPGLLLGLAAMVIHTVYQNASWDKLRAWLPFMAFLVVSIVMLHLKVREIRPMLAVYGVLFIVLAAGWYIRLQVRTYSERPLDQAAGWLILAIVLMYGIAFGPMIYYYSESVNPSIWGFFSLWVPGFNGMRAVGRIALIGQTLVLCLSALWVWALWERVGSRARRVLCVGVIVACALQGLDSSVLRARQRVYDEEQIRPTTEEKEFFQSISGSLVAFPAAPFPRNTSMMLYFAEFRDIRVMNGYSGKSTPLWDAIMQLEREHGRGAPEPVRHAVETGVDYVAVRKDFIRTTQLKWLFESDVAPAFEGARWSVYAATDLHALLD